MDDLLAEFLAETREMLEASESELIAWEANPADREKLDAIFRFVHTVKGNCGFFDFPRLERLSHAAEDTLAQVRAGQREADATLVTAVLAIVDRIGALADAIEAGEDHSPDDDETLISALEARPGAECAVGTAEDKERAGSAPKATASRSIRLSTDLLDRVMMGVSDMVLARNDLAHRLRTASNQTAIEGSFERLTTILNEVRDAVTQMRMQRIDHLYSGFPRLVRDLSAELGKQVLLDLEGGDVELDREMIEVVRDPITHVLRNAIDHGIEPPAERLKAGKREIGTISISARQSGNMISITIADDGKGIDPDKIGAAAVSAKVVSQEELAQLNREEILQLVFAPGLSTADTVSMVSGRGVGLDVVRSNLERVGGSIRVISDADSGTLIRLGIPLTLSIISGVTIETGGQRFAIPQSYVEEIVRMNSPALDYALLGERGIITFRERRIPCLSLAEVLDLDQQVPTEEQALVVLRLASGTVIAVAVDQIDTITDLVVKPLPAIIMETRHFNGSTLLDDGTAILVLDIPQIAQLSGVGGEAEAMHTVPQLSPETAPSTFAAIKALVFDTLENQRSAMRMQLVNRIESVSVERIERLGEHHRIVLGGRILRLVGLPATVRESASRLQLLRISDGRHEFALAIKQVHDAADISSEVTPCTDEALVEGVCLVEGRPVTLVDGNAMLREFGEPVADQSGEAA